MEMFVTKIEDRASAVALIEAAEVLIEKASNYQTIKTEADASLVGEYRARLNKHITDLDNERLEMGKGLRDTLAKINEKFNTPINLLKQKLAQVDAVLRAYLAEQRRLADEAEARRKEAEETARREREREVQQAAELGIEAPAPLPPPVMTDVVMPSPTKIAGTYGSKIGTREVWKYKIVDIKKVPEAYLVPPEERVNKSVLNALAKSQKGNASVRGIEFFCEDAMTSRVVT